jgi:ABC-type sugar transport system ATPase subunit
LKVPNKIKIEIKKEQVLSKEMKLGIRPQDMIIVKQKKNCRNISGEIYHWEVRGDDGVAMVKVDKNIVMVKTPADFKFSKKEEVQIDFDPEKIIIFNKHTTKNICVSEKEFVSLAEGKGYY